MDEIGGKVILAHLVDGKSSTAVLQIIRSEQV